MANAQGVPTRVLGRTGERVSMIGLGGSHIGEASLDRKEAIRLMREAVDRGITFFDNSWDYHSGVSERRMGEALRDGFRERVFLMTKIDARTKVEASKQIDESLRRLGVEQIDLLQHHEVIRFEDADRIFSEGGAMEAVTEAQRAGKIRFIGFTGHKDPHIHLYMLHVAEEHQFRFDTVQMPVNAMDYHFRSFEKHVLPELVEREIAVIGMKSMGDGLLLRSKTVSATECLHYALNQPVSVLVAGIDNQRTLEQAVHAAQSFQPMSEQQVTEIRGRTKRAAAKGEYELFKTSSHFDSTAKHPEWLGGMVASEKRLTKS